MHAELVDQAKRGDREAFDALARLTGDRCMAIAFRILRDFDLADDAVQSALVTAWREIRTLRDSQLFEPWLHRILTNACYTEARRRRRRTEVIRLLPVEPVHGPDESLPARTPGPARARIPAAHRRAARRPRLSPLPRAPVARGGGPHRHSPRDREVPHAPRQAGAPGQPRGRGPDDRVTHGATRMTARDDLDRRLDAFLLDGPAELPTESYEAARDRIDQTRQRVVLGPWRFPDMNRIVPIGLGAAAVVVILVAGTQFLGQPASGGVGAAPTADAHGGAPSPTPVGGTVDYQLDGAPTTTDVDAVADGASVSGTAVTTSASEAPTPSGWSVPPGMATTWAVGGTTEETTVPGERAGDLVGGHRQGRLAPADRDLALRRQGGGKSTASGWLAAIDLAPSMPRTFVARGVRDAGAPARSGALSGRRGLMSAGGPIGLPATRRIGPPAHRALTVEPGRRPTVSGSASFLGGTGTHDRTAHPPRRRSCSA